MLKKGGLYAALASGNSTIPTITLSMLVSETAILRFHTHIARHDAFLHA
jgi:hypothetical protein